MSTTNDIGFIQSIPVGYDLDGQPDGVLISPGVKQSLGTTIAGEDIPNDVTKVENRNNATYISTATTTVCKTGAGLLNTLTVTGGTAGTIIGYDNTAASGTILFSFDSTNALATYTFNVSFAIGLTVVTAAATKLTVSAR